LKKGVAMSDAWWIKTGAELVIMLTLICIAIRVYTKGDKDERD